MEASQFATAAVAAGLSTWTLPQAKVDPQPLSLTPDSPCGLVECGCWLPAASSYHRTQIKEQLSFFQFFLKSLVANMSSNSDDSVKDRIQLLSSTCDELLDCLHNGHVQPSTSSWQPVERVYEKHIVDVFHNFHQLRTENGKLRHMMAANDTKILAVLNENEFLRWENEQFERELKGLREQLNRENLQTKELQAEVRCLQLNQAQINHIHTNRLRDELLSARSESSSKEELMRRQLEDLRREASITEHSYNRRIECLQEELAGKNDQLKRYKQKIEHLTRECEKIQQQFSEFRKETEQEFQQFYSRENELEAELAIALDKLQIGPNLCSQPELVQMQQTLANNKEVQRHKDIQLIENLRNQVNELLKVDSIDDEDSVSLRSALNERCLQVADLREKVVTLEEECRLEHEQHNNVAVLLTQMSRDMKVLLEAAKTARGI